MRSKGHYTALFEDSFPGVYLKKENYELSISR